MQGIVGIDNSTKPAAIGDNSGIRSLIKHWKKDEGDRAKCKSVFLGDYREVLQLNLFAHSIDPNVDCKYGRDLP